MHGIKGVKMLFWPEVKKNCTLGINTQSYTNIKSNVCCAHIL